MVCASHSNVTGFSFPDDGPTSRPVLQSKTRTAIMNRYKSSKKKSARQESDIRCGCIPKGTCVPNSGNVNTDGSRLIDFRIVTNMSAPLVNPCLEGMQACCVSGPAPPCGQRYQVPQSGVVDSVSAQFGAYPWQAAILRENIYIGSGVLVDERHIITAAHTIFQHSFDFSNITIRLGEWELYSDKEPLPHQDFAIKAIAIHADYNPFNLDNDIAIIRLRNNVLLGTSPIVTTACLPKRSFSDCNCKCWVSGWGKNSYGSVQIQNLTRQVDVVIQSAAKCQSALRNTRLGSNYDFNSDSFICAGGEADKDACKEDGGSPLSCEVGGRWIVPGLVSWGIGCGTAGVPGVYVNVLTYVTWIEESIATR